MALGLWIIKKNYFHPHRPLPVFLGAGTAEVVALGVTAAAGAAGSLCEVALVILASG